MNPTPKQISGIFNPTFPALTNWNHLSFSNDRKALAVCGKNGFYLYAVPDADLKQAELMSENYKYLVLPTKDRKICLHEEEIILVECFPDPKKLVVVRKCDEQTLLFCNTVEEKASGSLSFTENIISVKTSETKLAVGLISSIRLFDLQKDYSSATITASSVIIPVPFFVSRSMDLVKGGESLLLAYPYKSNKGSVAIYNGRAEPQKIKVFTHAIKTLCFNNDGTLLAVASVLGIIIRVYDVQEALCINEFLRGVRRNEEVDQFTEMGWYNYLTQSAGCVCNLMRRRHFFSANLPAGGIKIATFKIINDKMCLIVAASSGGYFVYDLDAKFTSNIDSADWV